MPLNRLGIPVKMPPIASAIWMPPMLPRCGMGGGFRLQNGGKEVLPGNNVPSVDDYIVEKHYTATAEQRWTKRRMTMAVKEKLCDIWGKRKEERHETL